jgi:hypothetical protein
MVYLVMVVVLIGGMWAVLGIGGYLAAPEDLAGKWLIQPADPVSEHRSIVRGPGLYVEQSGRFFQFSFDHGPQLNLKLQTEAPIVLTGADWTLTITGHVGSDDKLLKLDRNDLGQSDPVEWTAHRVVRTFPPDSTTKEAP